MLKDKKRLFVIQFKLSVLSVKGENTNEVLQL